MKIHDQDLYMVAYYTGENLTKEELGNDLHGAPRVIKLQQPSMNTLQEARDAYKADYDKLQSEWQQLNETFNRYVEHSREYESTLVETKYELMREVADLKDKIARKDSQSIWSFIKYKLFKMG